LVVGSSLVARTLFILSPVRPIHADPQEKDNQSINQSINQSTTTKPSPLVTHNFPMLTHLLRFLTLGTLAVIGCVGLLVYQRTTKDAARIVELEKDNARLSSVVERLQLEQRIAEFVVTRQSRIQGKLHTRLLLVERDRSGQPLPPRSFELVGDQIHIDALVVKFPKQQVEAGDPLRGHALLLLEKIYGDAQPPATAPRIDAPGRIPAIYRDAAPDVTRFETDLWSHFWQLVDDESLRKANGVDVAHGAGVFRSLRDDRLYILTLEPTGNLTLRDEPIPDLYLRIFRDPAIESEPSTASDQEKL
jgi:hypothetical protein